MGREERGRRGERRAAEDGGGGENGVCHMCGGSPLPAGQTLAVLRCHWLGAAGRQDGRRKTLLKPRAFSPRLPARPGSTPRSTPSLDAGRPVISARRLPLPFFALPQVSGLARVASADYSVATWKLRNYLYCVLGNRRCGVSECVGLSAQAGWGGKD